MRSGSFVIAMIMIVIAAEGEESGLSGRTEVSSANVRSYTVRFAEEVRFRSLHEDLADTCRASGAVRGCTEFPIESLECSCELDERGWRLRIDAHVETRVHIDHASVLVHERQHLRHLDSLLRAYLAKMTAPVFATERACDALARVLSRPAYVTSMMNELRTASNELFQCDRPGSNHPEGLLALEPRRGTASSATAR